jgi:hypothetical protein
VSRYNNAMQNAMIFATTSDVSSAVDMLAIKVRNSGLLAKFIGWMHFYPLLKRQQIVKSMLLKQVERIITIKLTVASISEHKLIDEDGKIRSEFDVIKAEFLDIRNQLQEILGMGLAKKTPQIAMLVRQTIAILSDGYEQVSAVQWDIAEHDANIAKYHEGFIATSIEDSNTILDRIAAAA